MAQDFGDEAGDALRRALFRACGYALREWLRSHGQAKGVDVETAPERDGSEAPSQPETVCLPFGDASDAAYFAQVCRESGINVDALSNGKGDGFIRFAPDDLERVQGCVPQFSEVMTQITNERIAKTLEESEPLAEADARSLREIAVLPDLPGKTAREHDASARDDASRIVQETPAPNHTEHIAREVAAARSQCRTFDDLQRTLAQKGIGVTVTKDGEAMFYEARTDDEGRLLPFGKDANGNRDWAVGAKTLKEKWGVDATHDSFVRGAADARSQPSRAEVQVADGSLDTDGRTPDINQGVESHDGMDTDTRTLRIEREQNGTDVAPSTVRAQAERGREASHDDGRGYSLSSEARDARAASKQLERESGRTERELDISDKMSQAR